VSFYFSKFLELRIMKAVIAAAFLALPLAALNAVPVAGEEQAADPPENPIFGPLYPEGSKETMRHFDAGINQELYGADGVLGAKNARLMAIATSAAIKCEYCVMAQNRLARAAGATEEEIRTALLLAADLQFRSTMLYGHEYSEELLEAQIKQMTGG
tara:strand:+ start:505 stop:975 length:471 start_codon:yes stop_codon:yes gene_type:complete